MRIAMYMIGACLVAAGMAYVAQLFDVPQQWIGVGIVVALGLGLMGAAQSARGSGTNIHVDKN